MLRRLPIRLALPIALMILLGVLATLQYRWLGQVSESERDRMRSTVSARATELAEDFDREITRLFLVFQLGGAQPDMAGALSARLDLWRRTAKYPQLLSAVYVAPPVASSLPLEQLDPASRRLVETAWTDRLATVRDRLAPATPRGGGPLIVRIPPLLLDDPLAVMVPLALVEQHSTGGVFETRLMPDRGFVLLVIDERYVRSELLPALVRQHLQDNLADYRVAIVDSRKPDVPVYSSDPSRLLPADADVASSMLSLRFGLADRLVGPELRPSGSLSVQGSAVSVVQPHEGSATVPERVTVLVEQRSGTRAAGPSGTLRMTTIGTGGWQLLLKHRAGSLEAAVARVRRRNLVMSFGMLALLAISTGLVFVSARRAERLAGQQMDFVATVSHELRTPLAVIRSAGQNLADGVVHDPVQMRQYGELIEGEGRRLTDMIEQTLALAGLSGDRRPLAPQPLDPAEVVRAVLDSPEVAAGAAGMEIDLRLGSDLPAVVADAMLLRRAVQNLVANALKYGGDGKWLGISVEAGGAGRGRDVRITVSDRGPGIDPRDLPHVFEPFYRGREAMTRQVQGNGLGLHLVKRIAEAHGGRVSVRSSPGHGAAFTLHVPVRTDPVAEPIGGAQPQHS